MMTEESKHKDADAPGPLIVEAPAKINLFLNILVAKPRQPLPSATFLHISRMVKKSHGHERMTYAAMR